MKSYIVDHLTMPLKWSHISKFPGGKMYYLGKSAQKSKAAHPVNYFPDFWAKILRIAHPVNYSYLPPCLKLTLINTEKCA